MAYSNFFEYAFFNNFSYLPTFFNFLALYSQTAPGKNMEKQKVDQIITDYLKKIYGFAIKKSYSYDEAEELC